VEVAEDHLDNILVLLCTVETADLEADRAQVMDLFPVNHPQMKAQVTHPQWVHLKETQAVIQDILDFLTDGQVVAVAQEALEKKEPLEQFYTACQNLQVILFGVVVLVVLVHRPLFLDQTLNTLAEAEAEIRLPQVLQDILHLHNQLLRAVVATEVVTPQDRLADLVTTQEKMALRTAEAVAEAETVEQG
jgi:hypothetical protein